MACGDDSGGGDMQDAAPPVAMCPSDGVPNAEGLSGPCCARRSNADQLGSPELRVTRLRLDGPGVLGTTIVYQALKDSLDQELFNWLLLIENAEMDGTVNITTGYGARNEDSTFSFASGNAPEPGDPNRWDPGMATATLSGDVITDSQLSGTVTVPILQEGSTEVQLELPLQGLVLDSMTLSEDRTCIGLYESNDYDTMQGTLSTFITVADARIGMVEIPPIMSTLCNFIAGMGKCDDGTPQSEWTAPPDSLCSDSGCMADPGDGSVCEAEACNAWQLSGGFAAAGVDIVPAS